MSATGGTTDLDAAISRAHDELLAALLLDEVGDDRFRAGNERGRFDRIFGVLFTAVLLSFGAPFWYRVLREFVGLKDALRKKEPPAPAN